MSNASLQLSKVVEYVHHSTIDEFDNPVDNLVLLYDDFLKTKTLSFPRIRVYEEAISDYAYSQDPDFKEVMRRLKLNATRVTELSRHGEQTDVQEESGGSAEEDS